MSEQDPRATGTKFSQFPAASGEGIEGVGLKDGKNVRFELTTDSIKVNPEPFRNSKGQFIGTPEELADIDNQRDVNNFLYNAINEIESGDIDLDGYATEAQLNEVDQTSQMRDDALKKTHDEDHVKQAAINAGVVVSLDELFWRDVELDEASSAGDAHLQKEIDELALALNTILLKHDSGKWKYIGDINAGPPRKPGELTIVGDMDGATNGVIMHSEDLDGVTHQYADIEIGDYMELVNVDDPEQYILYVVTDMFDAATNMLEAHVALKRKSGDDFAIDTNLEVRYYQVSEQDIALEDLDERYVAKAGDAMTGTLETPHLKAKNVTDGEMGKVLVEGWVDGTGIAAQILMSNKKYNAQGAYGSLSFKGQGADGWFQFDKDIDMSSQGLHSVKRIRLVGDKVIQEAQTTRIKLDKKVIITKVSGTGEGFTIEGKTDAGDSEKLLQVYHNSNDGYTDAVNYYGKMSAGTTNLATCKYVDDAVGAGGGSLVSTSFRCQWNSSSSTNGYTFYTQQLNGYATTSHASTKFLNIRLPSSFWTVKADVVPAGRDTGYVTIIDPANGQIVFSAQVIVVNNGGATFKVDCEIDLWTNSPTYWTANKNYLIRMESCFREA